jgi:hypothetical protein
VSENCKNAVIPKFVKVRTFDCSTQVEAPICATMSAAIIDARKVFAELQRATRLRRFETELAAFEHRCSDRARSFIDMFEAVAWARRHPQSAIYSILTMDDDQPDQVLVLRLARTVYNRASKSVDI